MSNKWNSLYVSNFQYDTLNPPISSSTSITDAILKETSCTSANLMALGYNNGTFGLSSLNHGFLSVSTHTKISGSGVSDLFKIAVDSSSNSYVASYFQGSIAFGSTTLTSAALGNDMFLAKLGSNNTWSWAIQTTHTSSSSNSAFPFANAVDSSGNSYVCGRLTGTVTFGATTLTGNTGTGDTFVAKISSAGSWLWAVQSTSSSGGSNANAITIDSAGNPYIHCSVTSNSTFGSTTITNTSVTVSKLNPSTGAFVWTSSSTGASTSSAYAMCSDSSNNIFISGFVSGTIVFGGTTLNAGSNDTYVAKLNSSGSWLWATNTTHTGGGNSTSTSIVCDTSGNAYVAGYYGLNTTFGSITLTTASSQKSFISKISSAGSWLAALDPGYQNLVSVVVDSFGNPYSVGATTGGARFINAYNSGITSQLWTLTPADSSNTYYWVAIDSSNIAYILGFTSTNVITVTKANYPISGSKIVCTLASGSYNSTISCAISPMLVTGFSGLVAGSKYYASTTPTPTLTVTSYPVGMANSTTDLIFNPTNPYLS